MSGAIEGFLEGLEQYDVANTAEEALGTAGDVARAAGEEGATQAQTPEMRQLGRGVKKVGTSVADATSSAATSVKDAAVGAKDAVKSTAQDVKANVSERIDATRERVSEVAEDVRFKAGAVAETSRRAGRAPPRVAREWRGALGAWWKGLTSSLGLMALVGVIGLTAWIVLTIALVVAFNRLLGDPVGTFLVFGIYVVAALGAYFGAKAARKAADERRAKHMANAREEVRHVTRPVREAFGGTNTSRGKPGI